MEEVGDGTDRAPEQVALIGKPRVRRRVWLNNERGDRLGYAVSWWAAADADQFLPDKHRPIGGNMATARLDVYRELVCVMRGVCPSLAREFGCEDADSRELWCRYYVMWRGGRALNLIYECFSPVLERWMGPVAAAPALPFSTAASLAPSSATEAEAADKGAAVAAAGVT